ncbi:hypothetical protein IFM89_010286, partial [Coptis chinensis]
ALVKLGYWVFGLGGGGYGSGVFVSRRDGSLAGREVVVEKRRFKEREGKKKDIGSFYRSSVYFVLNYCSRCAFSTSSSTFAQIDGEDARQFVVGLADSIGLQNAFEMQGKCTEARMELLKIYIVLQIFPPQESSPEMEMVA